MFEYCVYTNIDESIRQIVKNTYNKYIEKYIKKYENFKKEKENVKCLIKKIAPIQEKIDLINKIKKNRKIIISESIELEKKIVDSIISQLSEKMNESNQVFEKINELNNYKKSIKKKPYWLEE